MLEILTNQMCAITMYGYPGTQFIQWKSNQLSVDGLQVGFRSYGGEEDDDESGKNMYVLQ